MNKRILAVLTSFLLLSGCSGTPPQLGVEDGQLKPCLTKPNCVSSQGSDSEHSIEAIISSKTQLETKESLLAMLNEEKSADIKVIEGDYIRAEFVSKFFRFVDDVEFYFPDTESNETLIQVRSASRVGHSDFGVNRERIEEIRNNF